jgi:hypothetical protein
MREVNTRVERVREDPHRWPRDGHDTRRSLLPYVPFSLVYLARNGAIDIVVVMHARQRPGDWRSRSHASTRSHPYGWLWGTRTNRAISLHVICNILIGLAKSSSKLVGCTNTYVAQSPHVCPT